MLGIYSNLEIRESLDPIIKDYFFKEVYNSTTRKDSNPSVEIIGITNFVFTEQSIKASDSSSLATNALTATVDSTTYPDHAVITLKNERGFNVYLTQMVIDGQPILRYKNTLVHDSLRRDDDIRKNGEKLFEIGNEYIIDGTQVDRIADFYYKDKGKKKHLYSVAIKGFCPWYSVGDWYTFTLGAAGWNEHINSTVEVYDVTCSRTAGGIGSTTLVLREVEENWTKTTFYTARARSGASPKRRSQQSNTLIVAASTFDGTYDYKCDGTADDVEIQAAIDYVYNAFGGGTIQKTAGTYKYNAAIVMRPGVRVVGVGPSTIDKPASASVTTMYDFTTVSGASLENLTIDGNGDLFTYNSNIDIIRGGIDSAGNSTGTCIKVNMQNYRSVAYIYGFRELLNVNGCVFSNCTISGGASALYGYYGADAITNCIAELNNAMTGTFVAFWVCKNVTSCIVRSNYNGGIGFHSCRGMAACLVTNNVAGSYDFNAFATCDDMTSCISSNNTTTGSGADIFSFFECYRIGFCSTIDNTTISGTSFGFYGCRSVQQCKSNGDDTAYYQSYADSGTTNPCADTYQGGYNS